MFNPLQTVKTSFLYIKKNLHFTIFYMHAQGLSSVTKKKKKVKKRKRKKEDKIFLKRKKKGNGGKGIKKSRFNNGKFYIYTISLGRDSRSPFLLHTEEQITTTTHQNGIHQQMLPHGENREGKEADRHQEGTRQSEAQPRGKAQTQDTDIWSADLPGIPPPCR